MRKICVLGAFALCLASCGTIGIGSNHDTMIYNNSDKPIVVSADSGVYKINPEQSMQVYSGNDMTITSKNTNCPSAVVMRSANTAAVVLDVFPGFVFGIIPILVDAISNNLYKMPDTYSYSCVM